MLKFIWFHYTLFFYIIDRVLIFFFFVIMEGGSYHVWVFKSQNVYYQNETCGAGRVENDRFWQMSWEDTGKADPLGRGRSDIQMDL